VLKDIYSLRNLNCHSSLFMFSTTIHVKSVDLLFIIAISVHNTSSKRLA